jgi:hypothetical protein
MRKNSRERKDLRRKEAEARNSTWAAMSPKQQLAHLDMLGVAAVKQRAKIQKRLV